MPVTAPDFISLQPHDLDASQAFYEQYLGLVRSQAGPPHAVVFETTPIAFALRDIVPGTDLASVAQPGIGAAIWLHATDVQTIHDALVADGNTIVAAPIDGPVGRTFTFADHVETVRAGDAFVLAPGHTPAATAGSEFVMFSPVAEYAELDAAVAAVMATIAANQPS